MLDLFDHKPPSSLSGRIRQFEDLEFKEWEQNYFEPVLSVVGFGLWNFEIGMVKPGIELDLCCLAARFMRFVIGSIFQKSACGKPNPIAVFVFLEIDAVGTPKPSEKWFFMLVKLILCDLRIICLFDGVFHILRDFEMVVKSCFRHSLDDSIEVLIDIRASEEVHETIDYLHSFAFILIVKNVI